MDSMQSIHNDLLHEQHDKLKSHDLRFVHEILGVHDENVYRG